MRKVTIQADACLLLAALILLTPWRWCIGVVTAAAVHELCHLLAVFLWGGEVHSVTLRARGVEMEVFFLERREEAFCALAGPAGSLLLLGVMRHCPEVSLCALVQGLYNLIPVYPLDGGRFLRCLCSEAVCASLECFSLFFLSGLGLWGCFTMNLGFLCLLPSFLLFLVWLEEKYLAKNRNIQYNNGNYPFAR